MHAFKSLLFGAMAAGCIALSAQAATIFDTGSTALISGDPTQLGRLSRSGVISDWSTAKAFPGDINTSTSYHYHAYDIAIPSYFPYVQISIDDISGSGLVFASAYLGAYSPNAGAANGGLDLHYLGDAGASGNLFGSPRAYQVVMPTSADLIVVINDASATGAGIGQTFDILVEGFTDTSFDDAIPSTPEPVTIVLTAAGLAVIAYQRRRQILQA